jgi:hypothetical protein
LKFSNNDHYVLMKNNGSDQMEADIHPKYHPVSQVTTAFMNLHMKCTVIVDSMLEVARLVLNSVYVHNQVRKGIYVYFTTRDFR